MNYGLWIMNYKLVYRFIFSASLRRIIVIFSAKSWIYSKKVVSLLQ